MNTEKIRDNELLMWLVQNAGNIENDRQRKRREQEDAERRRVQEEFLILQNFQEEDRKKKLEQEKISKTVREVDAMFKQAEQKMIVDALMKDAEENIRREREERLSIGVLLYKMMHRQW